MPWERLGQVFAPDGSQEWAVSHAALPVAVPRDSRSARVFYSPRDRTNRSHIGWVDIDLSGRPRVINVQVNPVLAPGADGSFDDSGVSLGCIVRDDTAGHRMYYMGWNLGTRAPWRNAIGLAEAPNLDQPFVRFSPGPLLDRSPADPYTLSYPWVLRIGPSEWRMWYGSNLTWGSSSADMSHVIKAAWSRDGIVWERTGETIVGFADDSEYALARPSVVRIGRVYVMCFAVRGEAYKIGAAVSHDGTRWDRCDPILGLTASGSGFDTTACCYPCLFWFGERLWLAYNGDGYGQTGFALAVWSGALPFA